MVAIMQLILASSSIHRRELFERLQLPFQRHAPNIDESIREDETAQALVERLSLEKALKVSQHYPEALIIGSDEVATLNGQILNKPEEHAEALRQLRLVSGHIVDFITGVCLLNSKTGHRQLDAVTIQVHFRQLTDAEIERYLERDKPYDCTGSFRSEAGGITLVHRISGDDDTSLLGLPLISLAGMLRNEGCEIP